MPAIFNPFSKLRFPWHIFTTRRVLTGLFTFFSLITLASGAALSGIALMWMFPYTTTTYTSTSAITIPVQGSFSLSQSVSFLNLVLTSLEFYAALVVGVILCATFFVSVPAFITHSTGGLTLLNLVLTFDVFAMIFGAATIWWRGLRTRNTFWDVWVKEGEQVQMAIQAKWQCCGYWDASSMTQTATCDPSEALLGPCVDPFTTYADSLLNGVSTFMFCLAGFLAAWVALNACEIAERNLQERFRRIDEKRERWTASCVFV